MFVKMVKNKGAVVYRGAAFVGSNLTEVTEAWFGACKNPRVKRATDKQVKSYLARSEKERVRVQKEQAALQKKEAQEIAQATLAEVRGRLGLEEE